MRSVCSTLALISLTVAAPVRAQVPLSAGVTARSAPGGTAVATLNGGTMVVAAESKGTAVLVTIDGWVDASRLGPRRDSFPVSVGGRQTLRIRATPSLKGTILGELKPGAGVLTVARQGSWAHVRRSVWVPASAVPKPAAASANAGQAVEAPPAAADSAPTVGPAGSMSAVRGTKVLSAPGGRALGDLASGAIVEPLARRHGWVRVRVEGWVPDGDLAPADSSFGAALTAADLRADPQGTRGKVVRWTVQVLSYQTADPLRRDMAPDEPYLLAKGPGSESALLYLAIPTSLLNEAKSIAPLTTVLITARVRNGHSEPVGTPILDLESISRR